MALSNQDIREIYTWLSAGWPTVLKPGAPDDFVRAKCRELLHDFGSYDIDTIREAINRCRANSEKFPSTKALINEVKWIQAANRKQKRLGDDDGLWPMLIIYDDGYEACYGQFYRPEFVNHPKNVEHLEPEEWLRRFNKRRDAIIQRMQRERQEAPIQ